MTTKAKSDVAAAPGSRPNWVYLAGIDCGLNGPSTINSHFGIFSTPEKTREWERGKAEGDRRKSAINQRTAEPGAAAKTETTSP